MRAFIAAGGVLLALIGGCGVQRHVRLAAWGTTAPAKVRAVQKIGGRGAHAAVDYGFVDADGRERVGRCRVGYGWSDPVGTDIEITHLESDPTISKIAGTWPELHALLLFLGLAATAGSYGRLVTGGGRGRAEGDEGPA
ncbi:MAG: hypothetical protein ACYTKD_04735 [Planctomycetota bacterium]